MRHVVPNDELFDAILDTELGKRPFDAMPEARCAACEGGDCFLHRPEFRYSEDQPRGPDGK
jgi:hypothetical protein